MDDQNGTGEAAVVASTLPGARSLHSDPHDFAGLYIRHRSSFTLHARRYLRDQRDADEVVQEAFLRLFLALPELETELQALAYCRRTITNLCIDRFRAQARRPLLVDLESVPVDALVDDDYVDPVVRAEDAALVRAALSMLSPLHRAALVKREIEEKTLPEIAEELAIPEESVKHVLFRARRALRRILAESSLAPGGDGQLSAALAKAVSKGGIAVVAVLLAAVGLGTGPNLRAIPVVGRDLPDLPSLGQLASSLGEALRGGEPSEPAGDGVSPLAGGPVPDGAEPFILPPEESPSASPTATVETGPATSTVGILPVDPTPTTPAPAPSMAPSPSTSPSPSSPSPAPSSPAPSAPAPASPAPSSASPSPSASPSASPGAIEDSATLASPRPSEPAPRKARVIDPTSWENLPDGVGWQVDPDNPEAVKLVPISPGGP